MEMNTELSRLFEAFPNGYINDEWYFIFDYHSSVGLPLEPIQDEYDTARLVTLFASYEAYTGKISPLFWVNWQYRARLRAGVNKILRQRLQKVDFGLLSYLIGDCHNIPLAKTFVEYGANMSVLRRYLKDHNLTNQFEQFRQEHKIFSKTQIS